MTQITLDKFLQFCKTLEGKTLETLHRPAPFTVQVVGKKLRFMPQTNKPRTIKPLDIERALEIYNETGSLEPSKYISENIYVASYLVALFSKLKG